MTPGSFKPARLGTYGHLDAVCTWYDSGDIDGYIHLTVLHGNPDGGFGTTPLFTRTFGNGENEDNGFATILSPVLVADLNGDGYADIISLSGDGYCVLLGGPNTTWNGQPHQFVAASLQSQEGLAGIYGVSIANVSSLRSWRRQLRHPNRSASRWARSPI